MAEVSIRISNKLLLTLSIILISIVLACVACFLWSSDVFTPKYTLRGYVPGDSDLKPRSAVYLEGVRVGTVIEVDSVSNPTDSTRRFEVVMKVAKRYQGEIRSDSTAAVIKEGLGKKRFISIRRGLSRDPIASGGEIQFVPTKELTVAEAAEILKRELDRATANKTTIPEVQRSPQ